MNDRIVIGTLAPPQRSEDSPTYRGRVIGFDALLAQGEPTWWGPGLGLVVKDEREINPKLYSVTQKTFSKSVTYYYSYLGAVKLLLFVDNQTGSLNCYLQQPEPRPDAPRWAASTCPPDGPRDDQTSFAPGSADGERNVHDDPLAF